MRVRALAVTPVQSFVRQARQKLMWGGPVFRRVVRETKASKLEGKFATLREFVRLADRVVVPASSDFLGGGEMEISAPLLGMGFMQSGEGANALDDIELWPVAWETVANLWQREIG